MIRRHNGIINSNLNIKTNLDVKITLKDKYFIYIAKFGLPKNGIFDMKKLEEC